MQARWQHAPACNCRRKCQENSSTSIRRILKARHYEPTAFSVGDTVSFWRDATCLTDPAEVTKMTRNFVQFNHNELLKTSGLDRTILFKRANEEGVISDLHTQPARNFWILQAEFRTRPVNRFTTPPTLNTPFRSLPIHHPEATAAMTLRMKDFTATPRTFSMSNSQSPNRTIPSKTAATINPSMLLYLLPA